MAATVKKEGIRKRRFPQSSTKHALATPYILQWPGLKNQNQVIIDHIVKTLEPLHFKELCTRMPTASAENNEETTARILEERKERARKLEQRSNLELGLNQVTRALEKGTLKLVLVDRSIKPTTLLEHLLLLCATRKTAACAVSGLGESAIPMLLGVRRAAAFGFKNTDTPTVFDELVDFIKERIPPLYVPWLHPSKENSEQSSGANPFFDEANESDSDDEHLPGIQEMYHEKRKRKRNRKQKEDTGKINTQSVTTSLAINTGQLKENTGMPVENTGIPLGNTGMPVGNTRMPVGNTRMPVGNTGMPVGNTGMPVGNTGMPVGNTGMPVGNTGMPVGNTGMPVGNTGMPVGNTGTAMGNTGTPTANTKTPTETPRKLKLSREELLEVFGTSNSAPSLITDTSKKKRKRRFKEKQKKKCIEPPVKLVYLRPCIKSFDTATKDKGDQKK